MNTNNNITEPIDIPKRGRGRPKKIDDAGRMGVKHPTEPVVDVVVTSEPTRVNRGGRPRLSDAEVEKRRLEKEAKPKGKRGPPKGDVPRKEYLRTAYLKYYNKDREQALAKKRDYYYRQQGRVNPRSDVVVLSPEK